MSRTSDYPTIFRDLADTLEAFGAAPSRAQAANLLEWVHNTLKGRILDTKGLEAWLETLGGVHDKSNRFDKWVGSEQEVFLPSTSLSQRGAHNASEVKAEASPGYAKWCSGIGRALARLGDWKGPTDPHGLLEIYSDPSFYEYMLPIVGSSLGLTEADVKKTTDHYSNFSNREAYAAYALGIDITEDVVAHPEVLVTALTKHIDFVSHALQWSSTIEGSIIGRVILDHLAKPGNAGLAILMDKVLPELTPAASS